MRGVGPVDEPVEPGARCTRAAPTISRTCSTTGIHSRNLDDLAPLVLVPGVAEDLADRAAWPRRGVVLTTSACVDGALGMATPSGDRPAFDSPGPRTIASTMRSSSSSSPGISSTMVPRDITSTRSQRPESSIGSLDLTSRAAPASVRGTQRLVDVEAGADVDTLGGLVGQDHRRLPEERPRRPTTFCWLPPERNSTGCSSDGVRISSSLDEIAAPRRRSARRRRKPEPAEPAQRLDGGVDPHAEHAASTPPRLRSPGSSMIPARTASWVEISVSSLPSQTTRARLRRRAGPRGSRRAGAGRCPRRPAIPTISPLLQGEADRAERLALKAVDHEHLAALG